MNVFDLFNLKNKVALVTGGGSGIGLQIVKSLSDAGCQIVICSRKIGDCEEVAEKLSREGRDIKAYRCDVTNKEDIDSLVQKMIKEYGKIDILVNNSGTTWGEKVEDMPLHAWENVMQVNVTGTFLMSQAVGKEMIRNRSGKIINIASAAGLKAKPPEVLNAIGYSTSKAAVIHFTKDLARKWAHHGIYVNAIAPGFIPTKMTEFVLEQKGEEIKNNSPLKQLGDENAVKGVALLLASSASNFITGEIISVDGGSTL